MADSTLDRKDLPALKGLIISRMLGLEFLLFLLLLPSSLDLFLDASLSLPRSFAALSVLMSGSSLVSSFAAHRWNDLSWLVHRQIARDETTI